ncbi:MAG: hypothetical protein ABJA60_09915 [Nitrosospira sp.]
MSNALRFNFGQQSFHSRAVCVLVFAGMLGLPGCASISPTPFNSLSNSVQQLRGGADASLGMVNNLSRERYIAEGAAGDPSKYVERLLLKQDGDKFSWISSDPPLFFKADQFREGVYQLNSVLVDYTNLLAQLASPDLVAPPVFDKLARDLNGNLRAAAQTLKPESPDKDIAILSTASTAAFRAYLQHRQRASLISALKNNQAAFSNVATLGANAVEIEEQHLRKEYQDASYSISTVLQPALSAKQKEALLRKLVELDEKFIKELVVLKALHQSYKALPAAHSELAKGLANPKLGLPMIQEIFENSQRLYRLYEELRKPDGGKIPSNAVS